MRVLALPAGRPGVRATVCAASLIVTANLPIFLTGALSVQVREGLALGRTGLGTAIAVILASAAIGSSPLGQLAQRWGPVRSLRLSTSLTSAGALGVALVARGWLTLLPALALIGAGLALAESAGNLLLQYRVRAHRLGSVFGIKQAAPPLAALVAGLTVPLAASSGSWRPFYGVAAALALGNLLLLPPAEAPRNRAEAEVGRILRRAPLLVLSAGLGCGFAATNGVAIFLVDSAVSQGVPAARAGLYLTLGSLVAIVTRLTAGRIADGRSIQTTLRAVVGMMLIGTAGHLMFATGNPSLVLLGSLLAFGVGYGWAGLAFLAVARIAARAAAAATGLVLTGGFIGGLAGPALTGALADNFGYPTTWTVLAGLTAMGGTLTWIAGRWVVRIGDGMAE